MLKKKLNFNLSLYLKYFIVYFLVAFTLKNLFVYCKQVGVLIQNNFFEILLLQNTGAAFSLFKGGNLFLAIFSFIVFGTILYYISKNYKNFKLIDIHSFAFLSAGILSNTVERIVDGYVTDYFRLVFINFPVFNLADIFINIGVILMIFSLLFFDKKEIEA